MVTRIFNNRLFQIALTLMIVLGAVFCVFTPNYLLFKIGSRFAVHIMLGYLVLGILFLGMRQPKLTFTSFACCAGLCLFLKYYSNWDWPIAQSAEESKIAVSVGHFNAAASDADYESTIDAILNSEVDIVSIQEVTPDWHQVFQQTLKAEYPHSTSMVRFDPYGLAIYSKKEILNVDTFYHEKNPNLLVRFKGDATDQQFCVISSYTTPPLYQSALTKLKSHMEVIAEHATSTGLPTITVGEYHAPPWWEEIRYFMAKSQLQDSRSCATQGLDNLWKSPIDYLFYSDDFKCIDFSPVQNGNANHLGIKAAYEINNQFKNAQAAIK